MSAASVTLPVHYLESSREAIQAYVRGGGGDGGRGSRASDASRRAAASGGRRSGGTGRSSAGSYRSGGGSSVGSQSFRSVAGSAKAPLVETLYSGSFSGRTSPSNQSLASTGSVASQPSWLTKSNDWTTTGNSTDRSSVYSFGDLAEDEFDRESTRRVQRLFDAVDSWMFEDACASASTSPPSAPPSASSQNECRDWSVKFPHFRLLGSQLLPPGDGVGFQSVGPPATSSVGPSRPATGSVLIDVTDNEVAAVVQEGSPFALCLTGKTLRPLLAPTSGVDESSICLSHLVEEVFAIDGHYEEYLAFDSRLHSSSSSSSPSSSRFRSTRSGLPPVTPHGCLRDSILADAFDVSWSSFVSWSHRLLLRFHESLLRDLLYDRRKSARGSGDAGIGGGGVAAPSVSVGVGRRRADRAGRNVAGQGSGGSAALAPASFIATVSGVGVIGVGLDALVRPNSRLGVLASRHASFSSSAVDSALDGVLTISSKELHHQHKQQQQHHHPQQQQHQLSAQLENAFDATNAFKSFSGSHASVEDHRFPRGDSQTTLHFSGNNNNNNGINNNNNGFSRSTTATPSPLTLRGQTSLATLGLASNVSASSGFVSRTHGHIRSFDLAPPMTAGSAAAPVTVLRMGSARASAAGSRRNRTLQPLDRDKTPVISIDEGDGSVGGGGGGALAAAALGLDIVRGVGLNTAASPPLGVPRNLPPIEVDPNVGLSRLQHPSKRKNSAVLVRASSAVADKNPRNATAAAGAFKAGGVLRGREPAPPDDRPNTTHTFRPDSKHNRRPSSPESGVAVLGAARNSKVAGAGNLGAGVGNLGAGVGYPHSDMKLTGVSLAPGATSFHPLDSLHHHPSEEEEEEEEVSADDVWNSLPTRGRSAKSPSAARMAGIGAAGSRFKGKLGPFV